MIQSVSLFFCATYTMIFIYILSKFLSSETQVYHPERRNHVVPSITNRDIVNLNFKLYHRDV